MSPPLQSVCLLRALYTYVIVLYCLLISLSVLPVTLNRGVYHQTGRDSQVQELHNKNTCILRLLGSSNQPPNSTTDRRAVYRVRQKSNPLKLFAVFSEQRFGFSV